MPQVQANGLDIEYESLGDGEPLLLVMGLGRQLVMWADDLCQLLVDRGFRVIRFDNRDVGLSTHLDALPTPRVRREQLRALLGVPIDAPYTLLDMADDTAGLLDALGVDSAHVVGASMGGMIAQMLAIAHPSRVRSLTSIMSSPGNRRSMLSRPYALRELLQPPPRTREEAVEAELRFFRTCGGSRYPIDEDLLRDQASRAWDRGTNPAGVARQITAILATGDRRGALRFVRVPTVVLHGSEDPLVRPAAGRATARAIPGARLKIFEGLGHRMPRPLWPEFADEIHGIARVADRR